MPATDFRLHIRVNIGRPDGITWVDVTQFVSPFRISCGSIDEIGTENAGVDTGVKMLEITLNGDESNSFNPFDENSAWNQFGGQYEPLAWYYREIIVETQTTAPGLAADPGAWIKEFHGLIGDNITPLRNNGVRLQCRDFSKQFMDCYLDEPQTYGTTEGVALETAIQQMSDANFGAGTHTLYTPVASDNILKTTTFEYIHAWDMAQKCATKIGWFLGFRRRPATGNIELTFMEPPRTKDINNPDITISWQDAIISQDMSVSDNNVRNWWKGKFINRATGQPETVTVFDNDSRDTYGGFYRKVLVELTNTDEIDTLEEMTAFLNAALADTKDALIVNTVEIPYNVDLDLFYGVKILGNKLSSADRFFGVISFEKEFNPHSRKARTTFVGASKVVGRFHKWIRMIAMPGGNNPVNPNQLPTNVVPTTPTGVTAVPSIRGGAVSWNANNDSHFDYFEVHLSEEDNFTPDAGTLAVDNYKATSYTFTDLTPLTVYYVKLIAVDNTKQKSAASSQASFTAGQAGTGDIEDGAVTGRNIYQSADTTGASTSSASFVDITNFSVTFTLEETSDVLFLMNLTASAESTIPDHPQVIANFRIALDGIGIDGSQRILQLQAQKDPGISLTIRAPVTSIYLKTGLAAGEHTIKGQFSNNSGSVTVAYQRTLTYIILKK
jgi:hypothetical protein